MFTEKMYKALRRDHQGKRDTITILLDEIDRLNLELNRDISKLYVDESNNPVGFGKFYGEHSYNNKPIN
jgi:hypothetical protein